MTQAIKMALKSIGSNKSRAILTMLGIIIGVMALVILVSLVNGATGSVTDKINELGSNMLTVTVSDNKGAPVYLDDIEEWSNSGKIGETSAVLQESFTAKHGSTSDSVTVYGTTPSYYDIQGLNVLLGRFIKGTDVDNHTNVCVINETTASEIVGFTDCLGEELSLDGVKYLIVGVLEDDDSSLTGVFGSGSSVAYIPYSSFVRLSSSYTSEVTSFYAGAAEGFTLDDAETELNAILLKRFDDDEDAFSIKSMDALEDAMSEITSVLTLLLAGIAAISLIVGGIGIMNIMLVTVTERTREIGIRKAIGANRKDILMQFLMESVVLCMLGCAIGIFLSWSILKIVTIVVSGLEMTFNMNGTVVLIAVLFCFAIGILFGLYPANKAAKMAPIDALHHGD